MSTVKLVAAITIRSINDGDNDVVFIKLELSGVILPPSGHYTINFRIKTVDGSLLLRHPFTFSQEVDCL